MSNLNALLTIYCRELAVISTCMVLLECFCVSVIMREYNSAEAKQTAIWSSVVGELNGLNGGVSLSSDQWLYANLLCRSQTNRDLVECCRRTEWTERRGLIVIGSVTLREFTLPKPNGAQSGLVFGFVFKAKTYLDLVNMDGVEGVIVIFWPWGKRIYAL